MKPDEKWRLESISVRSFRGVAGEHSLSFGGRSALLHGNNGVGKSTMALALQWTLFGKFPSGVLPNVGFKNFLTPVSGPKNASRGEVLFRRGGQTLTVKRDEQDGSFSIMVDSKTTKEEEADCERDTILGLDMDTFVRAVLLHQSRVRGLLLDEVKDRNHAIDMLLGVEAAQDLHDLLKVKPFLDAAIEWRSTAKSAQEHHGAKEDLLKTQYDEAVAQARIEGFLNKDFNWTALSAHYDKLVNSVHSLALKHGVQSTELAGPANATEAKRFGSKVVKELNQIKSKAQSQILLEKESNRAQKIQDLIERWDQGLNEHVQAHKLVVEAEKIFSSAGSADAAVAAASGHVKRQEELLESLGQLHKLLTDARAVLAVQNVASCPVCSQPIDVSSLNRDLEVKICSISTSELIDGQSLLSTLKQAWHELRTRAEQLTDQKHIRILAQMKLTKLGGEAAVLLGLQTISESKVRQRLVDAAKASADLCQSLKTTVESLDNVIEQISSKTTDLECSLVAVVLKREEISRHGQEGEKIRADHAGAEKNAALMESLSSRMERIRIALLESKEQLATERLTRARPRSLELYERLVRHPKFSSFNITTAPRAKKVDYSFEVSVEGNPATAREAKLVLSDGQITATAVGIFLGLAESAAHSLDLLFIDDPTQNLDLPCKEAMAKLMVEMTERKQIILSTHDEDFVSYLKEYGFDKKASVFHIESWNGNPRIVAASKLS